MNEKRKTPFLPGDRVTVVDGTFEGMTGVVVTVDEARRIGGERPPPVPFVGHVWVVLTIFERPTAVYLMKSQVAKS